MSNQSEIIAIYPLFDYDISEAKEKQNDDLALADFNSYLFSNNVLLRRITKEEIELFHSPKTAHPTIWSDGAYLIYLINEKTWVYEVRNLIKNPKQNSIQKANEAISKSNRAIYEVELAMKLLKSAPGFCKLFIIQENSKVLSTGIINTPTPYKPNTCVLDSKDIKEVDALVSRISKLDLDNNSAYRVACERLSRSFEERREDDKIIDIAIAFEGLFTDKVTSKLEYMGKFVGLGASMLLGNGARDREAISCFMQKAFSIRNDIVHSNTKLSKKVVIGNKEYTEKEFTNQFQSYLKECLKKLI